jgi:hypothetical protein
MTQLSMSLSVRRLKGLLLNVIEGRCYLDALARGQTPTMRTGGPLPNLFEALLAPAVTGRAPKRA